MAKTITPYMQLTLPEIRVTGSPEWATDINILLETVDLHDHTINKGTKVPIAGLNINANFNMNSYAIYNLPRLTLNQQSALLTTNDNSIFLYGGDLYYRNSAGTNVKITDGAGVNVGGTGNITGMGAGVGTPAVAYSEAGVGTGAYNFREDANIYADINCSNLTIYEHTAGISEGVELASPAALVASYTLTFPGALPATDSFLVLSPTGVFTTIDRNDITFQDLIIDTLQVLTGAGVAGQVLMSDALGNATWQELIPVGTKMIFYQAAAPTGWTRVTGFDASGNFLRLVNSGGGSTGGSWSWSTDSDTHSHTNSSMTATGVDNSGGSSGASMALRNSAGTVVDPAYFGYASGSSPQGQHGHYISGSTTSDTHSHTVTSHYGDHKYADVCLCSKD